MRLASRLTAGAALALTACWVLALAFSGSTDVLFYLSPALLILAPLVAGRYIGEELIAKLAARRAPRTRARRTLAAARRPRVRTRPRGSALIAFSLAERPPPALAAPTS